MKAKDVKVGATYMVKVSGRLAPVRLERVSAFGGWDGINLVTGRSVRVRTAGRLRIRATAPAAAPEPEGPGSRGEDGA